MTQNWLQFNLNVRILVITFHHNLKLLKSWIKHIRSSGLKNSSKSRRKILNREISKNPRPSSAPTTGKAAFATSLPFSLSNFWTCPLRSSDYCPFIRTTLEHSLPGCIFSVYLCWKCLGWPDSLSAAAVFIFPEGETLHRPWLITKELEKPGRSIYLSWHRAIIPWSGAFGAVDLEVISSLMWVESNVLSLSSHLTRNLKINQLWECTWNTSSFSHLRIGNLHKSFRCLVEGRRNWISL